MASIGSTLDKASKIEFHLNQHRFFLLSSKNPQKFVENWWCVRVISNVIEHWIFPGNWAVSYDFFQHEREFVWCCISITAAPVTVSVFQSAKMAMKAKCLRSHSVQFISKRPASNTLCSTLNRSMNAVKSEKRRRASLNSNWKVYRP